MICSKCKLYLLLDKSNSNTQNLIFRRIIPKFVAQTQTQNAPLYKSALHGGSGSLIRQGRLIKLQTTGFASQSQICSSNPNAKPTRHTKPQVFAPQKLGVLLAQSPNFRLIPKQNAPWPRPKGFPFGIPDC